MSKSTNSSSELRRIPSLEKLLQSKEMTELEVRFGRELVVSASRDALARLRKVILTKRVDGDIAPEIARLPNEISKTIQSRLEPSLTPAVNATGIIVHTNLGRAPLSKLALASVSSVASGYANLEFDLNKGERGSRHRHASRLLRELFPDHDALVVNNAAAGVMLALNTLADDKEVIISRGELVEIGGSFRIPDILEKSGARLREVGTTNKTRLSDYEQAISEDTGMLLRVHPSNFRIVGFTETVSTRELVLLARSRNIAVVEDFGSGNLESLAPHGLEEPWVAQSLDDGVDLTVFSGDKLLGGPQAGILIGNEATVARCRDNPMARALRVGKLTYAALEATLASHVRGSQYREIPVLMMLSTRIETLQTRAESLIAQLKETNLEIRIESSKARVGGGAAPDAELESVALSLTHPDHSAAAISQRLRSNRPAVVGRIADEKVYLDLRTVLVEQDESLIEALAKL